MVERAARLDVVTDSEIWTNSYGSEATKGQYKEKK